MVGIWVRIVRLIEEKGGPTTKMKYIIIIKKNWTRGAPGSLGPPLGSVPNQEHLRIFPLT